MNNAGPFLLRWRGQVSGPFSQQEVLQKLDDHEIGLWHEIGREGEWATLGEFLEREKRDRAAAETSQSNRVKGQPIRIELSPAGAVSSARQAAAQSSPPPEARNARSIKLFVLLGALAGFTGAHNFYAGYRGTAIAQFVLAGVTVALGFGFFISWLWALIELLIVHTDARGVRMR